MRKNFVEMAKELKKKNIKKIDGKILDNLVKKHLMDYNTINDNWDLFVEILKKDGITIAGDLRKTNIINNILKEAKWLKKSS